MKKCVLFAISLSLFLSICLHAQQKSLDHLLPVRGLCIAAPIPRNVDNFINFIKTEMLPRKLNTLILRIDYHYQFSSHSELTDTLALSKDDVKKIVSAAREARIRLIPQVNLLGHQSWANKTGKLLTVYPQFDETPWLLMPAQYSWPNADSLYCKSYCPLHPDLHKIVFDVMDELCTVFESKAFHAGMDEVFILGDPKCARCNGKSKAKLFAGEVKMLRDHLAVNKKELWIWGDRLLDGRETGVGMWEGSYNDTHSAIDLIPKDVVICDWHYERADKTAPIFAKKGFRVISCPWRRPDIASMQIRDMIKFRQEANSKLSKRYLGVVQTVWSSVTQFLNGYYGLQPNTDPQAVDSLNTAWNTFRAMYPPLNQQGQQRMKDRTLN